MRALILAAGLGTRLRPLTNCRPKPLIPFANTPLIDYHLELLKAHGIKELAVNLHHLPQKLRQHLGDGRRFGLKLQYSWEPQLLGTGGGIKQMAHLLPRDTLVVLNSDMLTNIDLTAAFKFHRQHKALATMVLIQYKGAHSVGRVGIDGYRIHQIAGRPGAAPCGLKQMEFAGIHLIEPELLDYIPEGTHSVGAHPVGKPCCINAHIYPSLIEQGKAIYGYPVTKGYWRHLGTAQSYLSVHQEFLAGKIPLKTKLSQTEPGIWLGDNVSISPQAKLIPPVIIGANSQVATQATVGPYAVLGEGCQLAEHCVVEHSILWDGVRVGQGVLLRRCVVADEVAIKESQSLTNQLIAP